MKLDGWRAERYYIKVGVSTLLLLADVFLTSEQQT